MIRWFALVTLALLGCATRPSKLSLQLEADKWSILDQTFDANELRKKRLRVAIERIQKRKAAPRYVQSRPPTPPVVVLRPESPGVLDEVETVADSSDEWMHHYYRGLSAVAESQFDRAISEFQSFMRADPSHVYIDRAQYWVVESHYRNREYGMCVLAANEFLSRHGDSLKSSEVLYRRGLALGSMGQRGPAAETLREILRKYPSSRESELATAYLARLGARVSG